VVTVTAETLHAVVLSNRHRRLGWGMVWHRRPAAARLVCGDWTAWVARDLAGPHSWWIGRGEALQPAHPSLSGTAANPAAAVAAAENALLLVARRSGDHVRAATGSTR
jgi:hypothetical protein